MVAGLQLPGRDQRRRVDHRGECEQQSGRRDHLYRDDRRRGTGRRGDRQPPTHQDHPHSHPRGRRYHRGRDRDRIGRRRIPVRGQPDRARPGPAHRGSARPTRWNSPPAPTRNRDRRRTPRTAPRPWAPAAHTGRDRDLPATQPHRRNPFGHGKHILGFRRFTSRGLRRAAAEWNYHGAVNNLFKAITTGHLTSATVPATG